MRVVVVSGIWPPDVGGPATHAPAFAEFLRSRGHDVVVVTTAARSPEPSPLRIRWVSRRSAAGVRHLRVVLAVAAAARDADVVYATGMIGRSGLASLLARVPLVIRLVTDPAYERALRLGLTRVELDQFEREHGLRIAVLRLVRSLALRRATQVICPSSFLADRAVRWGFPRDRITVVPSSVTAPALDPRENLRRRHGLDGPTLVFVGRFVAQKSLETALEALGSAGGVNLVLVGDGPERPRIEGHARRLGLTGRVRFVGAQGRQAVFELLRAGDALLLSSSTENLPHAIVEALSVGTPVIATSVGGVPEVVEDGKNGLLVPPQDSTALGQAIERFFGDVALRERLRAGAASFAATRAPVLAHERLEQILRSAVA